LVQKKVHAELDERAIDIGGGQVPSFEEIMSLEYLNAAWNESMRWSVVAPTGMFDH
jgi:hypothetical protein